MLRPEVQPLPPRLKKKQERYGYICRLPSIFSLRTFLQLFEKTTLEGFRIQIQVIMRHRSIPTASNPPGYYGAFARLFQSRGWGISKFCPARGSGICQPRGHPRAFDTYVVSYPNITLYRGFYQKTSRLAHLSIGSSAHLSSGKNCWHILDFTQCISLLCQARSTWRNRELWT